MKNPRKDTSCYSPQDVDQFDICNASRGSSRMKGYVSGVLVLIFVALVLMCSFASGAEPTQEQLELRRLAAERREVREAEEQQRLKLVKKKKIARAKQAAAAREWRLANRYYVHSAEIAQYNLAMQQAMVQRYAMQHFFWNMHGYNYYGYRPYFYGYRSGYPYVDRRHQPNSVYSY